MKKTSTILALLILTISIWAQSPDSLSYQSVVRDSDGELVTEQAVQMQISILQGTATGTEVYVETHTTSTNANGLITVKIGGGTTSDDFSTIDWSAGPYFIKTEIDPTGGTDYTITGTSQLLSVPYAKYADKAGSAVITGSETAFDGWDKDTDPWALNGNKLFYNGGSVGIGTDDPISHLNINSGAGHSYIRNQSTATGATSTDGLLLGIDNNKNAWAYNYEDGDLRFGTNNSTRMAIKNDGNVGIGTISPGAMFEVHRDNNSYLQTNLAEGQSFHTLKAGDNVWTAGLSFSTGGHWYMIEANDNSILQINQTGTINIYGDPIYLRNTYDNGISSGRDLYISSAGELGYISSSKRYKTNIRAMGDFSAKIFDLSPVIYDPIKGKEKDLVGLIAEDVELVMPELVSYNKEGEPETVYYSKLVPLLLNEIIKLKSEIDDLKQKIE